jgi:hypothetical protein
LTRAKPFEVVEEPSAPIVTEPPAAPKIFRGVSPDVDYSSGDQFWSESREVAENYAGQTGTEGTIDEATPETLPKNLYTATDKPTLKDELELKSEPFAPEFDAEAKTVLQARGFEGIRYESGTDLGGEQAAEFHVFGKPKQQAAQQPSGPQPGIDVSTETDGGSTPPGSTVVEPEPPAPVTQPAPTASTLGERIRAAKGINDKRTVISQALETGEFASAIVEAAESGRPIPYVEGSLGYLKDTFYAQLPKSVNTDKISLKPIKPKTPEDAAAPFASTDTSRYVLNTVFFDAENKGVVSTDGRRLIFIPSKVSGKSKMVAARNFQKTEGGYYGGKKATGEKYQKGKPVDGNFPNWKQVVPEERKTDKVYNIDIDGARRSGAVLAGINSSLSRGAISGSEAAPALVTVGEARFNPQFIYDATTQTPPPNAPAAASKT